jgi:hypothetical protein
VSLATHERTLAAVYLQAKRTVIEAGFAEEADWQASVDFDRLTEPVFLREAAWVILCAGMSETVVRRRFSRVSDAFLWWTSARSIVEASPACRRRALSAFNHRGKVGAIIELAQRVAALSFDWVRSQVADLGVDYLKRLPFVGPVTSFHLAKNIGLQVAKPDRHLIRIARMFGYSSVQAFCGVIAQGVFDPVPVVDIVLWRYATLHRDYRNRLGQSYANLLSQPHFI